MLKPGDKIKLICKDLSSTYVRAFLDEQKRKNGIWEVEKVNEYSVILKSDVPSQGSWSCSNGSHEYYVIDEVILPKELFEI
jgi:hypothetical protein